MTLESWADPDLGRLYAVVEVVRDRMDSHSTEHASLGDALKAIELADTYVEKRAREA